MGQFCPFDSKRLSILFWPYGKLLVKKCLLKPWEMKINKTSMFSMQAYFRVHILSTNRRFLTNLYVLVTYVLVTSYKTKKVILETDQG